MTRVLITFFSVVMAAGGAQPRAVSVYTFSRDSHAGLADERLDAFRRELGKYASSMMEIAYSRDAAAVTVQLLGQGHLTVELDENGDTAGHTWTPDEDAPKMWAIVRVSSDTPLTKEFSVLGASGRDLSRLAKAIGDWLQANSTTLRE